MAKKLQSAPSLLRRLRQEGGWIARFAWSPNGREIGAGSQGGFVTVWEVSTGRPTLTNRLRTSHILNFIWHPDGKRFFTSDDTGRISVWDAREGVLIKHINMPDKIRNRSKRDSRRHIHGLALLRDARRIVAGGPFGLLLWEIETGSLLHHSVEHRDIITIAVSPDGQRLASTSYGDNVCIWNAADLRVERRFPATYSCALAWSPDSKIIAATKKNSIVLWDAESGRATHVLEGHTVTPRAVAFSSDGKLFASRAGERGTEKNNRIDNKVMIWSTPTGNLHAVIEETAGWYLFTGLAFEPGAHRLATTAEYDRAIHIWDTGSSQLIRKLYSPVFYKNAKVALVGDSGVGKSGLALVLTGRKFAATHSTHARRVAVLRAEKVKVGAKRNEVRETVLWDLAGQPGYRLIHQLHLDDVALALIVFDSKDERDPFAGARHWNRALLNARLAGSQLGALPKRMLVAARIDRGPVSVSKARIDEFCGELSVDCGYAETSAKENIGIGALVSAIAKNVPWKLLPTVTSNALFQKIKSYLTDESKSGRVLATVDELYRGFLKKSRSRNRRGLRAEFSACVERLESLGLLREFSFGDLILLQPELLDVYASSIIFAAKQEPDGMGTIPEQRVLSGEFPVPVDERIRDKRQESLLLHATVEDLVRHELALREASDDGQFLVFPSQLTRENPDLPDPVGKSVVIDFAGPVINIYATLVVRLSHSGFYRLKTLWRNAATFESGVSGAFGVFLSDLGEGVGRMTIFYDSVADYTAKQQFEDYITTHLVRRALPATVRKRHVVICPSPDCNTPVADVAVDRRKGRGLDWIACNVCDTRIPLISTAAPAEASAESADVIGDIDTSAKDRRQMDEAVLAASGEMLTPVFKKWVGAEAGTIALVFTDVVGSTAMAVELGDESMEQVRRKHFDNAYAAAARNHGYVIKTIGDAFMVAFRTTVKALNFALDLKASTGHERVKIRAGIHVGPVHVTEEDVFGTMVNYTSRVVSCVSGDEIWLSNHAYEDIQLEKAKAHRSLTYVEHATCELKGFKGPQKLWEVRANK